MPATASNSDHTPRPEPEPQLDSAPLRPQNLPTRCAIGLVHLYQRSLSPLLGANCRYHPTCSAYMIQAIEKFGLLRGVYRGGLRLLRCHPLSRGGYDPP